jgi:hypothetical protein
VTIQGWDKNEVLARSNAAARIDLKRRDAAGATAPASRLDVVVIERDDERKLGQSCGGYSDIELNVPRGAKVQVQTRDGNITVVEVASVYAGTQNGDIRVEHAARGIEACNLSGAISVQDSAGRISLSSSGGTIEVENVRPADSADAFEVATVSGDVSLDRVTHAEMNVRTINGNVHFTGPLVRAGRYGFKTMSGGVTLSMPSNSSFQLSAKVSQEKQIVSNFPLTLMTEASTTTAPVTATATASMAAPAKTAVKKPAPAPQPSADIAPTIVKVTPRVVVRVDPGIAVYSLRRVNAVYGAGESTIYIASFSGPIRLEKN